MPSSENYGEFYEIFRDVSAVVHSSTDLDEVLELVVWKMTEVLGAKGAALRTLNQTTGKLELFASYGLDEKYLSRGPLSDHQVIMDLCKFDGAVTIDDILTNPRVKHPQELRQEGIVNILDIPLSLRNDMIGIIRVYFTEPRKFSDKELELWFAIGKQCACAIEKTRLIEEQQTRYDNLALYTEKLSALGRMAAGIAHEINNPLAGILLFSTNLRKKVPEEGPLREGLEVIIRESQRCKGIIQDLLEFSRDKEPEKAPANINDIIENCLTILENEFRLHHISVEKVLTGHMPKSCLDRNLMQQVLVNLFLNAVEAIRENGVITVRSLIGQDNKWLRVEIEDSGCGIAEDNMAKIFEPFFSTKANGTGLGLAVSYGVVQKHQGNITVSNLPGNGARFTIDLPVIQESIGRTS